MKKMTGFRRGFLSVMFASMLLVIGACSQDDETASTPDTQGEKQKVVVTSPFGAGASSGIPYWIGGAIGYYEEEGIEVEVEALAGRPAEAVGLVSAGRADLTISQPDAIVYPLAEGNDLGLTWVFTPYQAPVFGIAVSESSDITDPKQLEDKTVGMQSVGPPFETFMAANVKAAGGDSATVESVAVGGAAAMEALKRGDVDAIVGNRADMMLWSSSTETKIRVLEFPAEVKKGFAAGFIMNRDAGETERDAAARYLRAVLKSGIFAQENPEAAVRLNWELYPATKPTDKSEEEALEEAKTVLLETVNQWAPSEEKGWGYISEERWRAFIDAQGLSKNIDDPTVLFDYSLLELINSIDEEEVREFARNFKVE